MFICRTIQVTVKEETSELVNMDMRGCNAVYIYVLGPMLGLGQLEINYKPHSSTKNDKISKILKIRGVSTK
jgi:hypothetical protein